MPELSFNPADSGDEAGRLNGAKNSPTLGINLIDLPVFVLRYPETPFCPSHTGATAGGRLDRGDHLTGLWIDLLDAIVTDLIQVLAVESRARMCADIKRACSFPSRWVERLQIVAGCDPNLFAIKGDSVYAIDTRKGSILTNNLCC